MKKYPVAIIVIIAIIAVFFLTSLKKEKEIDFNKVIREVNQERKTILESETKNDIEVFII